MSEQKVFPKGIVAFSPKESAPSFVKGAIIITVDELKKWLDGDGKQHQVDSRYGKQVKLQITEWQGKLNLSVDTYRPSGQQNSPELVPDPVQDIPF